MKYLRKFDSVSDMETAIANSTIGILGLAYNNGTPVMKNKQGSSPVPPTPSYSTPFYIEDVSGEENEVQINNQLVSGSSNLTFTVETSLDGENWNTLGISSTTDTPLLTAIVPANGKLYLRCNASTWYLNTSTRALPIAQISHAYITTTKNFNVGGNVNSLLYGSSFNGQIEFPAGSESCLFQKLFVDDIGGANNKLINASNLILPAATLVTSCYNSMFQGCTALTTAPALPATTLAASCYNSMFYGCTSLTTAPELPATTLAYGCYAAMFMTCTALTTAPELPATTLVEACYSNMFRGCTALTTAPELPATTLAQQCYNYMFTLCSNLNYIKCLATDISATNCTNSWLSSVAATGTFVKAASMTDWTTGNNGIPSGWTVQNA